MVTDPDPKFWARAVGMQYVFKAAYYEDDFFRAKAEELVRTSFEQEYGFPPTTQAWFPDADQWVNYCEGLML